MLRRTFALTLASTALALGLTGTAAAQNAAPASAPLSLKVYVNPSPMSFGVASTLVTGKTEAVLLDSQFTKADAHRVVAEVLDSGKKLTTVMVTRSDPDYYFGLDVIQQAFPDVKIVASDATIAEIQRSLQKKLATWSPQMGANAPGRAVIPQPLQGKQLRVDGEVLEIVGLDSADPDDLFVWMPSIKAIAGGVSVFGNFHLWMANTLTPEARAAWKQQLDRMEALQPVTVVPGHFKAGTAYTPDNIRYTRDYLNAYEAELPKAKDSAALIAAMKQRFPNAGLEIALTIGAKVNKGEMKW
ncbi:MBL fold metallo-hydrolase [uncultured Rhodoferax sp.]|uniref:MBL fold metallo-hydrolase n=1 Tax=uncultured Rhodoferax sp. TaxID=223188 RepID=UPI0025FA4241|nr:MBL fold metallo-hydrolase [uncultured Rhodoferax sp.]